MIVYVPWLGAVQCECANAQTLRVSDAACHGRCGSTHVPGPENDRSAPRLLVSAARTLPLLTVRHVRGQEQAEPALDVP